MTSGRRPATVARLSVQALRALGIDTLFCLPGIQNDDFFDALVDAPDIRTVVTRHEQGAAYMALGAAQVTGRPAAFCVVPGPGMLNSTAGLTSAYWGNARVLALVGAVNTRFRGRTTGVLHDLPDPAAVLAQVTKHTALVGSGDSAPAVWQQALDELVSGRARPVAVEVPINVWRQKAKAPLRAPRTTRPQTDAGLIDEVARLLGRAERPLIMVGGGAQDASGELRRLAEVLQAPVSTRRMGLGIIDARHPLHAYLPMGHELWAGADVVLAVGTRLEFPSLEWERRHDLTVVQIDIDTAAFDLFGVFGASGGSEAGAGHGQASPNGCSTPPETGSGGRAGRVGGRFIGVQGDAAEACAMLLDALATHNRRRADRTSELARLRAAYQQRISYLEPQISYLRAIRSVMPDDGVIVEDATQVAYVAHLAYEHRKPRTFLSTGGALALGAGVAHGIGAAAALGSATPQLTIVGDGGMLFTAAELATAVQHCIPTNVLLFDNRAYGNVRRIQQAKFGPDRTIATRLRNPDWIALGESMGVHSQKAASPEELPAVLSKALEHQGPSLVAVDISGEPDPWPLMRARTRKPPPEPANSA